MECKSPDDTLSMRRMISICAFRALFDGTFPLDAAHVILDIRMRLVTETCLKDRLSQ